MKKREEDIGIYIHIPFCVSKCPYCDFNSIAVSPIPEGDYTKALIKEIDSYTKPLTVAFRGKPAKGELKESLFLEKSKQGVGSIYFGGGTPSLFSVDNIARVIDKVMSEFSSTSHVEITLEINPKTSDMEKLRALYAIGINRLNLGVQSFQDKFLQNLGRIHTSADAVNLFKDARSFGFSNIGLDLIFGIPDQALDDWERDLSCALSLKPEHISVYNLTIEEDTPFYDLQRKGKITLPDEDIQVRMYMLAQKKLTTSGYEHYEISNFALPGFGCRHNEGYWTLKEYFGFGAGAHSYLRETSNKRDWGIRWKNIPNPYEYISLLSNNSTAVIEKEGLTREIAIKEAIFLGLRRLDGISFDYFEKRFGLSLEKTFVNIIPYLLEENLISTNEGHLKLTLQGILLSNEVFLKFF